MDIPGAISFGATSVRFCFFPFSFIVRKGKGDENGIGIEIRIGYIYKD